VTVVDSEGSRGVGDQVRELVGIGDATHNIDIIDEIGLILLNDSSKKFFNDFCSEGVSTDINKFFREHSDDDFCEDSTSDSGNFEGGVERIFGVFFVDLVDHFGSIDYISSGFYEEF
jgi:hypothetical protein